MKKQILCTVCGKIFESFNINPKFCSKKCKGIFQMQNIDFEKAKELYELGMTQIEVAKELNTTQKGIFNLFSRNGYVSRIAKKRNQKGELNSSWKGDNATYAALHHRVYVERGKAYMCEVCGKTDKNIQYDWANITGNYADINDYQMMCRSCHFKMDGLKANFPNNSLTPNINKRKLIDGKL